MEENDCRTSDFKDLRSKFFQTIVQPTRYKRVIELLTSGFNEALKQRYRIQNLYDFDPTKNTLNICF